jgi:hypothetical protein
MKKILTTTALIGSTLIAGTSLSSAQVSVTGQLDLSYKALTDKVNPKFSYSGFGRESQLNVGYKGKLNNGIGFNAGFSWEFDGNEAATTAGANGATAENTYLDFIIDKTTISISADHVMNPDFNITNIAGGKADIDDVTYGIGGVTGGLAFTARKANMASESFGLGVTQDFGVAKVLVNYVPSRTAGQAGNDNQQSTRADVESGNSQVEAMIDGNFGITGARAFYYQGKSKADTSQAGLNHDVTGQKYGASYNFGQFTLAAEKSNVTSAASVDTNRTDYGVAYAVNKDLTVNLIRTKTSQSNTAVDETLKAVNVGYNLGPVTLNAWYATASDYNGTAGADGKTFMLMTTTKF